jgi:hypothetical protein
VSEGGGGGGFSRAGAGAEVQPYSRGVNLGGHVLAEVVTELGEARECRVEIRVVASGQEGHEHARRGRRRVDRREREAVEPGLVELGERVGQRIEYLPADLQVLVVAPGATASFIHVAPEGAAGPRR